MAKKNITHIEWLRKKRVETEDDLLKELLHCTIQMLMNAEVDDVCRAAYRERSEERVNSRNGYRPPRALDTRLGTLDLLIPKLRKGSYYPGWLLEPRKRSERALVQVISEAWVDGVSTRKMDRLVKSIGITGIPAARYRRWTAAWTARWNDSGTVCLTAASIGTCGWMRRWLSAGGAAA